ncbi:hypothetical protein V7S43_017308 [Phytophthora oleae]|uniref:Major facilitator superfamily (MFS) profile domain-containing protein n=1 Tax=Phytophthora oleae TaxID=2107226 RepID=A0ABD3EU87_9STRA
MTEPYEAPYASLSEAPQLIDKLDQSSMSTWVLPRAATIVVAAVLVVLCSGGLVLGFGPVYTLLVDEDQWSELCAPDEEISGVTCATQEVNLQYIYSTAFLCLSFANVASGISLDVIGARSTVCLGLVISIIGNVLLALEQSTVANGVSIIAGYSLIGVGATGSTSVRSSSCCSSLRSSRGISPASSRRSLTSPDTFSNCLRSTT